jgi:hypothetical protein
MSWTSLDRTALPNRHVRFGYGVAWTNETCLRICTMPSENGSSFST